MGKKAVASLVLLVMGMALARVAAAQAPLPVTVRVKVAGHESNVVEIYGTTLPGTVVSVRGGTQVVGETGAFTLRTTLPVYLVAVNGTHLRRLTMALPDGAQKWIERLTIDFNLSTMRAEVDGALTIKNHPPATVTVEHVQAGTTVKALVTRGTFSLDLPVVQRTNTLDWTLRAGWINWAAPPLNFTVQ